MRRQKETKLAIAFAQSSHHSDIDTVRLECFLPIGRSRGRLSGMNVKLIRAFIASPGGLEPERRAARAAADEINRSVAKAMGARLELVGWEETLSGNGRAQSRINEEMETCELFVGILWNRWGSRPAATGPYTSGFHEEFERSRERHGRTGNPEMTLFFKAVDPDHLLKPDDDLKQVLAFQQKLTAEFDFHYSSFAVLEEFAAKVREFLSHHVIRILLEDGGSPETFPAAAEKSPPAEAGEAEAEAEDAGTSGARFLGKFATTLRGEEGPSSLEVARLRLIAATSEKSGNDHAVIGVHDANLVYVDRAEFTLSYAERRGLAEAGLTSLSSQNTPVWTWLSILDRDRPGIIFAFTGFGEDEQRIGALKVLRRLGRPLSTLKHLDPEKILSSWFAESSSSEARLAALAYLAELGELSALPTIAAEAQTGAKETVGAAIEASLRILLRYDEHRAAVHLVSTSFETISSQVLAAVLPVMTQLGPDDLANGLDHRAPDVRARTVEILGERGLLEFATIDRARIDDSPLVRLAAVKALDRLGQPLSLDEAEETLCRSRKPTAGLLGSSDRDGIGEIHFGVYRAHRLRTMAVQPLKALLGAERHRDAAYRALAARRIDGYADALRADVADGFTAYFARHWPLGIPPKPVNSLIALGGGQSDPNGAKRRELTREGLDTLADLRTAAHLPLIRATLDVKGVSPTAAVLGFLQAFGDGEDITRVGETSPYSWPAFVLEGTGTIFDLAVRLILRWIDDRADDPRIAQLPVEMRARILELVPPAKFAKLNDDAALRLLLTDSDRLRRAAAMQIAASMPRTRVRKILAAYEASADGIYYIVRHWLDLALAYPLRVSRQVVVATREG